ncbi:MAG: copper homeostasis protein CutC [Candidatus Aminicenantes bacterium]|nr:copper homeostasis protein CutC [Candidatus Aminicenantes bacterium]
MIEVCVNSVESALEAERGGAHRVELCDNLLEGGTTPSAASIQLAGKILSIDLNIIIRPRGGDFCYSEVEFEVMKSDILAARELGAGGVVIGVLDVDGRVDKKRTQELIELARPMSVTFHRAFDMTADPFEALHDLIELKIDRILTSGQKNTAVEGIRLISDLVKEAGDKVIIMPGCGITPENIAGLAKDTGAREFHVFAVKKVKSPMKYRNQEAFMGAPVEVSEFETSVTDAEVIQKLVNTLLTKK